MTRRLLPVFLSMILLGPLVASATAGTANLPASNGAQATAETGPVPANPVPKSNDGRIAVTRSDGSTGFTKATDQKEIRKLVGYMRDGMNHANRSEQQRSTKKVNYKKK